MPEQPTPEEIFSDELTIESESDLVDIPDTFIIPPIEDTTQPLADIRSELATTGENRAHDREKSYSEYPIMSPAEDIDAITRKIKVDGPSASKGDLLKTAALVGQVKGLHRYDKQIEYQEHFMKMFNGDEALVLANKVTFNQLASELGYTVPRQFVVEPEKTQDQNNEAAGETFPDPSQEVFCKPQTGGGGRGVAIILAQDIPQFLSEHSDYILQERVPVEKEFRYVRQIDRSNQTQWRIAYGRVKPVVTGDGQSPVWQLIRHADIPTRMKIFATLGNVTRLRTTPKEGEVQELSVASNPPFGSYEAIPSDQEVSNLDKFMTQFIGDIEDRVGIELPTLCFDIGVTDNSVLEGDYDFEKMKDAVVPFECQLPFSSAGYFAKIKPTKLGRKAGIGFHRTMHRERNRKA